MVKAVDAVHRSPSTWDAAKIFPNLWVGSLKAAQDSSALRENGITHILTVAARLEVQTDHDIIPEANMLQIDIEDHPAENILEVLEQGLSFIDSKMSSTKKTSNGEDDNSAPRVVLVHCASGISRSAAVCCAYLMIRCRMTYDEALNTVQESGRSLASPNFGFQRQLRCLEQCQYDLSKTQEYYQCLEEKESSSSAVRTCRMKANEFHSQVDHYEERIISMDEQDLLQEQDKLILDISLLQNQIDNYNTDQVRTSILVTVQQQE